MLSFYTYNNYLYKIDLSFQKFNSNKAEFNLVKVSFNYVHFLKYLSFYYSKEINSENVIQLNIYLFFFLHFLSNIKIIEKVYNHKKKKFSNVLLKISLFDKKFINRFFFEFFPNNDLLELLKKNKLFLKLKFPILYNRNLKFLEIKKNNRLYIRSNYKKYE